MVEGRRSGGTDRSPEGDPRLRLGVFETFDSPTAQGSGDPGARLRQSIHLAERAEALGFDRFWVTEHHFRPGASMASPPVLLAAIAARTRTIRLGPLVAVLPLHDATLLAEEYSLLDAVSGGRLEMGVGPGYVREEFEALGLGVGDRDRRFEEALPTFLHALSGQPGRTPAGAAWPLGIPVTQRPHPPIWRAAARASSIRATGAAGHGLGLIPYASLERLEQIREPIAEYQAALPTRIAPRIVAAFHVHIGPDPRPALRAAQRFLESRPKSPDPSAGPTHVRDPRCADAPDLLRRGLLLFGEEADIADRLQWLRRAGVTDLAAMVNFGGLPSSEVEGTMRALARCQGPLEAPGAVPRAASSTADLPPLVRFGAGGTLGPTDGTAAGGSTVRGNKYEPRVPGACPHHPPPPRISSHWPAPS
jgi:alkanesulfonate monooxygenase SsuD/methylene tetrahydromethanopterin reductase-like flavin-dependent oxidoreductase (luciferase family)